MADTLRDALAASLASVEPAIDEPTGDLGYGSDVWCQFDVAPNWENVSANDPQVVVNAAIRVLITGRGVLRDAPDRGKDLRRLWNSPITAATPTRLAEEIEAELRKDDRIRSVRAVVTAESIFTLLVRITLRVQGSSETFELTFRLSEGKAELI